MYYARACYYNRTRTPYYGRRVRVRVRVRSRGRDRGNISYPIPHLEAVGHVHPNPTAFGLKVVLFQRARDARPDYVAKALAPARAKQPATASPLARLPFVISIGLLLATFSFPLHAASFAQATGPPAAWGRRAWGVLYGAG